MKNQSESNNLNGFVEIKRFPSFLINNKGIIYSIPRKGTKGGFVKIFMCNTGYLRVSLTHNCINKKVSIHRLIAEQFIANPANKPAVNHINGIKSDNRIENLEWCTQQENVLHAYRTGLKVGSFTGRFGYESNGGIEVHQYKKDGTYVNTYGSCMEAARALNSGYQGISNCVLRDQKTSAGFMWKRERI